MTEQAQGQAASESTQNQQQQGENGQQQATFTQADLKKIAANEKREGRTAAVNELLEKTGAESIEDVLAAYTEYQGIQEAVTTEADRANQRAEKMEKQASEYQERYTNTLRDFALRDALRDAGVQSESLGFVMRGIDKSQLSVDKDGNVSGVSEAVDAAKEEAPVLFEAQEERRPVRSPDATRQPRPQNDTYEGQMGGFLNNLLGAP